MKPSGTVLALLSGVAIRRRSQGAAACPQALEPHHYRQATRSPPSLLPPSGSLARQQAGPSGRLRRAVPDRGVGRDGSNWISSQGAVHRRITRWVSVSAVLLAVSSWGVARPGERR
jgi:hypothetical protein